MKINQDKKVLITGCSSGIGEYTKNQYLIDEYRVIGIDINIDKTKHKNYTFLQANLTIEKEVQNAFREIKTIDLAINCAGVASQRQKLVEFCQQEIKSSWIDNFIPAFNALTHEIKIMLQQNSGKIINIASIAGHIGLKNFAAYGSAKASIINMTKIAAIEYATNNILINSISPATIDTPMIRRKTHGQLRDYGRVYYTKKCGEVSDVFTIVKMLESNNFMTGQDIKLDGGLTNLFEI